MKTPHVNGRYVWASLVTAWKTLIFGSLAIIYVMLRCPRHWLDTCSRSWSDGILAASGIRVNIEGLEHLPESSCVLVGNHQGIFDILALMSHLPRPPVFVAKHTLFRVPLLGQAMKAAGHIPVNRSNSAKAIASIQAGTAKVRVHGDHVVFFPEGTRTRNGHMLPFKKGAFVFALESGLPLVPFAIEGSYRALPPGKRIIHSGLITVRILPAIETSAYTLEQRDQLLQDVHDRIAHAMLELSPLSERLPV